MSHVMLKQVIWWHQVFVVVIPKEGLAVLVFGMKLCEDGGMAMHVFTTIQEVMANTPIAAPYENDNLIMWWHVKNIYNGMGILALDDP